MPYPAISKTNAELIDGLSRKLGEQGVISVSDFDFKFGHETEPTYCDITAKSNGHKMKSSVALWFSYVPYGKRCDVLDYYVIAAELLALHEGRL